VLSALQPSPRSSLPFGVLYFAVICVRVRAWLPWPSWRLQMYTNQASLNKHTH
jgi:hypothetical protein